MKARGDMDHLSCTVCEDVSRCAGYQDEVSLQKSI